jgi:hypothetical protein
VYRAPSYSAFEVERDLAAAVMVLSCDTVRLPPFIFAVWCFAGAGSVEARDVAPLRRGPFNVSAVICEAL